MYTKFEVLVMCSLKVTDKNMTEKWLPNETFTSDTVHFIP